MLAHIIAAGEGTRFIAEGFPTPKPMLKIGNECMIGRLLKVLRRSGFDRFAVIVNEESDAVYRYLHSFRHQHDLNINIVRKSTPSSMHSFYELLQVEHDRPFHLFTVDTIFRYDEFQRYLQFCKANHQYDAIMAITPYIDDEKPLYVSINRDGVNGLSDEPNHSPFVTSGFYYFHSDVMPLLRKQIASGEQKLRNFLRQFIVEGRRIGYYEFAKTIDVDHVCDIEKARLFIEAEY